MSGRSAGSIARADDFVGVDSDQLRWAEDEDGTNKVLPQTPVEPTIEEDTQAEAAAGLTTSTPATPRQVKRNSYHRLSRLSDDARLSIQSIKITPEKNGTDSNRSSTTIKGIQINGTGPLNDIDFDRALRKFATERDSFLTDLSFGAGAVVPNRPKARPKTQRIVGEDAALLKSGVGSIRRRISFREMNSMKRQPSIARQGRHSRAATSEDKLLDLVADVSRCSFH